MGNFISRVVDEIRDADDEFWLAVVIVGTWVLLAVGASS